MVTPNIYLFKNLGLTFYDFTRSLLSTELNDMTKAGLWR